MENFRFEMTKVKFTPKYPPPEMENFRFEMTKVYSEIPPPQWLGIREIVCGDWSVSPVDTIRFHSADSCCVRKLFTNVTHE